MKIQNNETKTRLIFKKCVVFFSMISISKMKLPDQPHQILLIKYGCLTPPIIVYQKFAFKETDLFALDVFLWFAYNIGKVRKWEVCHD